MHTGKTELSIAAEKHNIPQIIVGYLKLQQAKKNDFFILLMDKKINGRLFYNTSLPDGTKETRYGNEDFQSDDFKIAVDHLLEPFKTLTLEQIKAESVHPSDISSNMQNAIDHFMSCIESSMAWREFWENEIKLQQSEHKKQLYNMVAGAAAYKAFVSCIDQSASITDPMIKRNIAALIGICTKDYNSKTLREDQDFALKDRVEFMVSHNGNNGGGDFTVFKKQKNNNEPDSNHLQQPPHKRKHRKKKEDNEQQSTI